MTNPYLADSVNDFSFTVVPPYGGQVPVENMQAWEAEFTKRKREQMWNQPAPYGEDELPLSLDERIKALQNTGSETNLFDQVAGTSLDLSSLDSMNEFTAMDSFSNPAPQNFLDDDRGIFDTGNLGDLSPEDLANLENGLGNEPTFLQKMFGSHDNKGWFQPVVGGALGAAKVALGYKQYKQAGEQLDFQKDAFNRNFAMQTDMINRRIGDRENARQLLMGNHKGAQEASKAYVEKYGVKNT